MMVLDDYRGTTLVKGPSVSGVEEIEKCLTRTISTERSRYAVFARHEGILNGLEKFLPIGFLEETDFFFIIRYCDSLYEDQRFASLMKKAKEKCMSIVVLAYESQRISSDVMSLFDKVVCFRDTDIRKETFLMDADKEAIRSYYEENIYGKWREGEAVSYELLGDDPKSDESSSGNPFEVKGGKLVKIKLTKDGRSAEFIVHVYLPHAKNRTKALRGLPFIVCMHPIKPKEMALDNGYALIVMDSIQIATDDTRHLGAFYDLYPYGADSKNQTGVLMAWAWGASKILDAVIAGLDREYNLDARGAMVTGVSRWGKATAVCGAFDKRFRMVIPACSGAGGLALYSVVSQGNTYDFSSIGGPQSYTYGENEPLSCLQSDAERGWFCDNFLKFESPQDIFADQHYLPILAMDKDRCYFIIAAYTGEDWVNAPAMWECYKKADAAYAKEGLDEHLVVHFHREGHAVIDEDMELIIKYFEHMYYGKDNKIDIKSLKTTVFA